MKLRYRDYRDNQSKVMMLTAEELIRRFLLHVLPKGLTAPSHPVTAALVHVHGRHTNPSLWLFSQLLLGETPERDPQCPQ